MGFEYKLLHRQPYYLGGETVSPISLTHDVALAGRRYMIDWDSEIPLRHASVPMLRQAQDSSRSPGEQSLNPEALWRRTGESWHQGAGQSLYDHEEDSSPFRFSRSLGFNVWDKYQLTHLNQPVQSRASANTNLRIAVAGSYLYITDGTELRRTQDVTVPTPTFTNITGVPGTAPTSIVSDGFNIWTAHAASGIYKTTRGAATTASHITGTVSLLGYVRNRVMAAQGAAVYDVTALAVGGAGGALPAALFTHGNTDFSWVAFAESQSSIFMAGVSGDKSLIYSTSVKPDGTGLDAPIVVAEFDGEIITGLYGYLGQFLCIGTSVGFRFALVTEGGQLRIGSLIRTGYPCHSFEGQERFIWFAWPYYESVESNEYGGLGRLDTSEFTSVDSLTPAYATDMMHEDATPGQTILSIVTFQGLRIFAVNGLGFYSEDNTLNPMNFAYIETGRINYGITEAKTAINTKVQILGMPTSSGNPATEATTKVLLSVDGGFYSELGTYRANEAIEHQTIHFNAGEATGSQFEIRIESRTDLVFGVTAFEFTSWLLQCQPRPDLASMIFATVFLAPTVEVHNEGLAYYDTYEEIEFLTSLCASKSVTLWQEGGRSYSVVLQDFQSDIKRLLWQKGTGNIDMNVSVLLQMKQVRA